MLKLCHSSVSNFIIVVVYFTSRLARFQLLLLEKHSVVPLLSTYILPPPISVHLPSTIGIFAQKQHATTPLLLAASPFLHNLHHGDTCLVSRAQIPGSDQVHKNIRSFACRVSHRPMLTKMNSGAQASTEPEPNNAALFESRRRQTISGSQILDNIVSFSNCASTSSPKDRSSRHPSLRRVG